MSDVNYVQQAGDILKQKNKEALVEIVSKLLPLALVELAKGSASPIDDVLAAALAGPLSSELLKLVEKI